MIGRGAVVVRFRVEPLDSHETTLMLTANLSSAPVRGSPRTFGRTFWSEGTPVHGDVLGPWSVRWSLEPR